MKRSKKKVKTSVAKKSKRGPANLGDFSTLLDVMNKLLSPNGCPWDREQTHETLIPYLIEESHEFIEAVENGDKEGMEEELGDLLLQVVFHAALARKAKDFGISDVITSINEKLIRRHPHVFLDKKVRDSAEVLTNWDLIKAEEKKRKGRPIEEKLGGPMSAPALVRSHKIGSQTRKKNFDWPDFKGVLSKLDEEVLELKECIEKIPAEKRNKKEIEHEIGDILFTVAQLARHLKIEAETSLRSANRRFEQRFSAVLALAKMRKIPWENLSDEAKEDLWQEIKTRNS